MSLIVATGSNLGDSLRILADARDALAAAYGLVAESRVYTSRAVDYDRQPDFFNQVLQLRLPPRAPEEVMLELLELERRFGRARDIPRGPRTLDLDIIFWGTKTVSTPALTVPHPRWAERSFVVRPLAELPFFKTIEKCFTIPKTFDVDAFPDR
jgi:2-amino-4-hydroxy-6-hydroxymethyldihydropteridine diphosphokinase